MSLCHVMAISSRRERAALRLHQVPARLDEMHIERLAKFRHDARGAQKIGHQSAAAGAELDEPQLGRRAEGMPDFGGPKPDQFAEHLMDLRRGDEIAARADRQFALVIAVLRVKRRERHEALEAHRTFLRDHRGDFGLERVHALASRRRSAKAMKASPAAITGRDNIWPMVAPAQR